LFRAIKTKSNPPKFGLIYHAKLIGMQPTQKKGKAARVLANNAALACRHDALSVNKGDKLNQRIDKTLNIKR
jgi:RNA processing factor Prp31